MSNLKGEDRIVYACAGCADVGEIADQVSRKLRKLGFATHQASCLVGIGAGLQLFIDTAKAKEQVITIDGCNVCCAKKMIENIGINPAALILTDMGLTKGQTACNPELVDSLSQNIIQQLS